MNTTPPLQNGLVSGLNPRRGDERRTRRWRQRPPRTPGGPRLAAPAGTVHSGKVRRNSSGAYDGCRSRPTRSRTDPQNPYQRHDGLDNMGRQSRPSIEQFGEGRVRAAIVQPPTPMFDASVIETTCGTVPSGAIPVASIFSKHTSTNDTSRHFASEPAASKRVATRRDEPDSRHQTTASGIRRPARATKSATDPSEGDSQLRVVIDAWPDLPEAVRAGILAIVKAALPISSP